MSSDTWGGGTSGLKRLLRSTPVALGMTSKSGLWGHLTQCIIMSLRKRKGMWSARKFKKGAHRGRSWQYPYNCYQEKGPEPQSWALQALRWWLRQVVFPLRYSGPCVLQSQVFWPGVTHKINSLAENFLAVSLYWEGSPSKCADKIKLLRIQSKDWDLHRGDESPRESCPPKVLEAKQALWPQPCSPWACHFQP